MKATFDFLAKDLISIKLLSKETDLAMLSKKYEHEVDPGRLRLGW